MTQVSLEASGPRSFLIYIVARVGPSGSYRPLAVTLLAGSATRSNRGSDLVRTCLQIITILSDPANQLAIQGELRLAEEFYTRGHNPPRAELPEPSVSPDLLGLFELVEDEPERGWDRGLREFPFLSACLLLGAGYDPSTGELWEVRTEPLGTAYRDDSLEYGMVALDISELERIRYGIVGFTVNLMAEVNVRDDDAGYDPVEDSPPEDDGVPTVEENRPRVPLSAREYMAKFHYYGPEDVVQTLEEVPLVDIQALDYIWPTNALNPGSSPTLVDVDIDGPTTSTQPPEGSKRTLGDQAIVSLIGSTQEEDGFNMSIFDDVLLLPGFSSRLLRLLEEHPDRLGPTRSAGQLLKLAYAGHKHLDWVPYKHLSADGIAVALDSPELEGAESLIFRIGSNCGKTAQLAKSLLRLASLQQLCVLQEPIRTDDDPSAELFVQLSAAAAADPRTQRLLQDARIIFTGAYSASLRKTFWLPTTNYSPPVHAFPVQQMFVRHQLPTTDDTTKFWPNHFYLGDALLSPQRFAAGFLVFLHNLNTDDHLLTLATSPPDLASPPDRTAISPIPAEAFTIPLRPLATHGYTTNSRAECWSKARDLVPGGWTVLVSQERYFDARAAARNAQDHHHRPTEARFIRYAFVRARERVSVEDRSVDEIRSLDLGPRTLEVGGLEEFLRDTAPGGGVDATLVRRRLEELARGVADSPGHEPANRLGQARLGPGMEWVSVLGHAEACDVLRDFFEDAAFVRRNLRLAMEENPTERNWYPELLNGGESRDNESESRNDEVFKALRQ